MKRLAYLSLLILFLASFVLIPTSLHAQDKAVVHAVLFYSPTCPHCQKVITEGLPPIVEKYGDQLQILMINVTTPGGQELYQATVDWLDIPENMRGVPTMVIKDQILVGDADIPAKLPGIVDEGLANGGIDWPAIPGFDQVLATLEQQRKQAEATATAEAEANPTSSETPTAAAVTEAGTPAPTPTVVSTESPSLSEGEGQLISAPLINSEAALSPWQRAQLDPVGSGLAIVILVGMVFSLGWVIVFWQKYGLMPEKAPTWQNWVFPLLVLIGMGIAIYLAFVETSHTEAVCGPVGDCNAVQQSPYAMLFGVLPVGVLGLLGYIFMLVMWIWQRFFPSDLSEKFAWLLPAATFFGVLFSAYLTFLEPFVIGAVCIWCLSSAVIMTLLLWLTYRGQITPRQEEDDTPLSEP
ncbi:MAG: vitamin K epoxide reductase [Chloroflexi bacterium]|nr:vitamin K epoxide reductase [Chloroflexota bacterium]